ncbi:sigma-70 family RNA polymerase sigma factor [Emcibacter sp.]|uniref:sigma-70 family RNA polymerase sigma factor n=1 Tax=Emcibacter sp. TaxID=1979954 RepID=UPI002AA8D665|nr:sigma-70 family RNA polymerase sigma factor [Emcibacter sp.]
MSLHPGVYKPAVVEDIETNISNTMRQKNGRNAVPLEEKHITGERDQEEGAKLLDRIAQRRDRQAFVRLYEMYAPRLKSFLMSRKMDEQQAEDLLQEVMLKIWRKADSYNADKARVSTWIFTVARNSHIDIIRRRKVIELDVDDHLSELVDEAKTDEMVSAGQTAEAVRGAIDSLSPELKQVIAKAFLEEMSHTEVAEALGLPLGTVKSRIRLAVRKLRPSLEKRRENVT